MTQSDDLLNYGVEVGFTVNAVLDPSEGRGFYEICWA